MRCALAPPPQTRGRTFRASWQCCGRARRGRTQRATDAGRACGRRCSVSGTMAAAHEQQQGKEFFNLDFEDEDEPQPEQPAATSASRYAAAGPVPTPPAKPTPPVYSGGRPVGAGRPGRGSNLVAADPEKTRVVGVRPAPPPTQQQPVAASASLCATASAAATQPSSSSPSLQLLQQQPNEQSAPPQPAFEGRGLQEVRHCTATAAVGRGARGKGAWGAATATDATCALCSSVSSSGR